MTLLTCNENTSPETGTREAEGRAHKVSLEAALSQSILLECQLYAHSSGQRTSEKG